MKKFLTLTTILCSSCVLSSCAHKCEGNLSGENCDIELSCVNGTPNIGITGDGHCSDCNSDWSGINCDITNECKNGVANIGITGDGHCSDCNSDWSGINCDIANECKNGVANTGINGDSHCSDCNSDWSGINCDIANECENGEANIGMTGDGHCSECNSDWSGINCDIANECENGVANTGINGDGHCVANSCTAGYSGTDCDQCIEGATGTLSDKAGKSYKTVCINKNFWMAENMAYVTGTYYHANGNETNDAIYGLLYDWDTANKVCPNGWHLPTKEEYEDLLTYVANNRTSSNDFLALSAKSAAWTYYSNQGGDDFGFGGLPAGLYNSGTYLNFSVIGDFWTSSEHDSSGVYFFDLGDDNADVTNYTSKTVGFSVRCLKDAN